MKPFFTIGITVHGRKALLQECLTSVLQQTFKDFEIIVANDYVGEKLSPEMFSVSDPRVRFVNNPQNLGEIRNMNSLMNMSQGKYFAWLADDDIYLPGFLEAVYTALVEYAFPPCVFTSYMQGSVLPPQIDISKPKIQALRGRDFLHRYLSRELKVNGTLGVFDSKYIKEIGGIEQLGNGFSPYADNLLVIKVGLQKNVVYVDAPLVFFRIHTQSTSYVSPDVDAYSSAQKDLLSKSLEIFASEQLSDSLQTNLFLLLKWCLANYCTVMRRSGSLQFGKLIRYLLFLMSYLGKLKGYRCQMMVVILRRTYKLVMQMAKEPFKNRMR